MVVGADVQGDRGALSPDLGKGVVNTTSEKSQWLSWVITDTQDLARFRACPQAEGEIPSETVMCLE